MTNVTVTVTSNDTSVTWSVISTNPLEVRVDTLPIGSSVTIEITADATPACNSDDFTNSATAFATNAPEVDGSATVQVDKSAPRSATASTTTATARSTRAGTRSATTG